MADVTEVAEMLAQRAMTSLDATKQPAEPAGDDEDIPNSAIADGNGEVEDAAADLPNEVSQDDQSAEEEAEDSEDSQYQEVELSDDMLITVMVDGKQMEVPLSELRSSYSHDGAAAKRLQEATETRKAATAERDKVVHDTKVAHMALVSVIKQLDSALNTPLFNPPDDALKATNPARYLKEVDAYNSEQQRLTASREALAGMVQEAQAAISSMENRSKQDQAALLLAKIPELSDPQKREVIGKDINEAAALYEFSPNEVSALTDHRLYLMALDALKYRRLQASSGKADKEKIVAKRVMRQGNTKPTTAQTAAKQQLQAARDKATSSGKPGDVAAYLDAKRKLNNGR